MQISKLLLTTWFLGLASLTCGMSLHAGGITVQEFREKVERGDSFLLIDVREPWEHAEFNLGGEVIPLGQLPEAATTEAIREKQAAYATGEIVVYDRTGARSGQAQQFLEGRGFVNVRSLTGGLLAWTEAFGNLRPQLQSAAQISPSPPPPPESVQASAGTGTDDTSAQEPVAEGANDETSEAEPNGEESGGDDALDEEGASGEEDVTADFEDDAGDETVAPEGDPGDEDGGDNQDGARE